MAYEVPGFVYTAKSSGAVGQFTAVEIGSGGVVATATTKLAIDGVAQMPAKNNKPEVIRVMKTGITLAVAGGVIAAGDPVYVASDGKFKKWTSAGDHGVAVGKALTGTADSSTGEVFSLLLA